MTKPRQFKRMTLQMTVVNTGVNKYKKMYDEANGDKTIKWTIVHWLRIDVDCLQFKNFKEMTDCSVPISQ